MMFDLNSFFHKFIVQQLFSFIQIKKKKKFSTDSSVFWNASTGICILKTNWRTNVFKHNLLFKYNHIQNKYYLLQIKLLLFG